MITSTIKTFQNFPQLGARMEKLTIAALNEAAEAGKAVADERAAGVSEFTVVAAQPTVDGYSAGITGHNSIWRVFDKGSLGKRTAKLKRPNLRKDAWEVKRRSSVYEAHRRDVSGKGIDPRNISNPARTAGRAKLLATIRRH